MMEPGPVELSEVSSSSDIRTSANFTVIGKPRVFRLRQVLAMSQWDGLIVLARFRHHMKLKRRARKPKAKEARAFGFNHNASRSVTLKRC